MSHVLTISRKLIAALIIATVGISAGGIILNDSLFNGQVVGSPPSYLSQFGGISVMNQPTGIAIDPTTGNVYVSDQTLGEVQVWTPGGITLINLFTHPTLRPSAVAINPVTGEVYVLDWVSKEVLVLDPLVTTIIRQWFVAGSSVNGIATDPLGNAYVTTGAGVQVYSPTGTLLNTIGSSGTGNGQFNLPLGVHIHNGEVYVVDFFNNRIQVFSLSGTYQRQWAVGTSSSTAPFDVTVDGSGQVHVTTLSNRVEVFATDGTPLFTFGGFGSGNGQFDIPEGIAASKGHIYVADRDNSRVQIFNYPLTAAVTPTGSLTIEASDTVLLTATGNGGVPPYSYQWYVDGSPVSGETSATFLFSSTADTYDVFCRVTDGIASTADSNHVDVTVTKLNQIIAELQSVLDWLLALFEHFWVWLGAIFAGLAIIGLVASRYHKHAIWVEGASVLGAGVIGTTISPVAGAGLFIIASVIAVSSTLTGLLVARYTWRNAELRDRCATTQNQGLLCNLTFAPQEFIAVRRSAPRWRDPPHREKRKKNGVL